MPAPVRVATPCPGETRNPAQQLPVFILPRPLGSAQAGQGEAILKWSASAGVFMWGRLRPPHTPEVRSCCAPPPTQTQPQRLKKKTNPSNKTAHAKKRLARKGEFLETRVWEKNPNCWRCDFFNSAASRAVTRENACRYDGSASGPIFYNINRDYDPATGRYVESDPIGLEAGVNTYGYALQNPLKYTDPLGLDVLVCFYPEGVGHVGFGDGNTGNDGSTSGFYPITHSPTAPGVVKPDPDEKGKQCKTVPAKPKDDDCMKQCQNRTKSNPPRYWLIGRQCTAFVRDCLTECGLPSGNSTIPPGTWFRSLPVPENKPK